MKNKLIILTVIIFFIGIFFIFDIEGFEDLNNSISIKNVKSIDNEEFENIKNNRNKSEYELVDLKCKNNKIPYDSKKNIYYIPKCGEEYEFDIFYSKNTIVKSIKNINEDMIKVIAYNKSKYKVYNICLTSIPVVNIELADKTNKKELIENDYVYGDVVIFDNESLKSIKQTSKIKVRGGTSKLYDKKSYSIRFIDSKSGEEIIRDDILGLDANTGYALNSLYEDESKIRDLLSNAIWGKINSDKSKKINIKYVEVVINNEYYGLYGLQELSNEYKLKINNTNSVLYKINSNNISYLNNLEEDMENSTDIVYSSKSKDESWQYLKDLMELVYYADDEKFNKYILDYIDLDNFVDNFILMETIYNFDGLLKNDVLEYNIDSGKFIKIPWDLDLTFSKIWDNNNVLKSSNHIDFSQQLLANNGNNEISVYLEQRLWENNVGNFRQKVAQKWSTLRKGPLETETLVNYANSLYDEVTESGAREREHERWPDGGYSTDNEFIETFIRQRLPYLDSEFLKYLDDTGDN